MRSIAALLVLVGTTAVAAPASAGERVPPTALAVSFKLDPRLSGPTYGGERWVSPRTYTGATGQATVEARAFAIDSRGMLAKARADWSPSDPAVVAVTPARGEEVTITARRAGESRVTVTAGRASLSLTVKVVEAHGLRTIVISQ